MTSQFMLTFSTGTDITFWEEFTPDVYFSDCTLESIHGWPGGYLRNTSTHENFMVCKWDFGHKLMGPPCKQSLTEQRLDDNILHNDYFISLPRQTTKISDITMCENKRNLTKSNSFVEGYIKNTKFHWICSLKFSNIIFNFIF